MLHNEIYFPVHNHLHLWVSTLGTRRLLALRESRGKPSVSYSSLRLVCFGGGRKLAGLSSERTRWSPRVAESLGTVFRLTSVQICFSLVQLPQNPNRILSAENLRSEALASNRALVSLVLWNEQTLEQPEESLFATAKRGLANRNFGRQFVYVITL